MKMRMILMVDYDDETVGRSHSNIRKDDPLVTLLGASDVGLVVVRREKGLTHFDGPTALAHEIGHVVANSLKLPEASQRDLTILREEVECEREAWDVARATGLPIDEIAKAEAYGTYVNALKDAEARKDGAN